MNPRPVRILYVDDYPLDRELVRDALKQDDCGIELVEAASREQFEAKLETGGFDAVISDFNILGFEGLQVLEAVHAKDPQLPVVIVTGTGSEQVAAEAIKRGAADYVIKTPRHIRHLPLTIQAVLEKKELETCRKEAEDALRESNELLSLFMKHSPIYAFIKEVSQKDSRFLMASENFIEVVGVPGSQMKGKTMQELFPPEFAAKLTAEDLKVVNEGKVLEVSESYNGRHFTNIKYPILREGRRLVAGYSIDITERKRSEAEINRRLKDLRVLYETSLDLSNPLEPKQIGRRVMEILKANLNWYLAVILLKHDDGQLEAIGFSTPYFQHNEQSQIRHMLESIENGKRGMIGWVLERGREARSGNLPADHRYVESNREIRSGLYVPMSVGGKVIGVIAVESEVPEAFNDLDQQLLATLAKVTANAIHRSQLHGQTELRLRRLGALRAIDHAIGSSFDLQITLDIFLRHAVAQLGADAALLLLVNPGTNYLEYAGECGFRNQDVRKVLVPPGEQAAGRVTRTRRLIRIPDIRKEKDMTIHPDLIASEGFITYHAVVLLVKGQVKGVLEVFHRKPMESGPEWLDFLETLAGQAAIAIDNNQLFESLQRYNLELAIAYDETIEGWSTALDMRDRETEGHTQRVARITEMLAIACGMSELDLVHVRRGALLHDIGKMGIPDSILLKTEDLTKDEWEIMRRHPQMAYDMLAPITYLRPSLDIPYCHHERWDGSGYPRGLKGEQIPLAARLFAVVDVWDALRSNRPYSKSWPQEKVFEYLKMQAGKHFDPKAVELFFQVMKENQFDFEE